MHLTRLKGIQKSTESNIKDSFQDVSTFTLKAYIGFLLLLLYVLTMLTEASTFSVWLCIYNIDEPPWMN